MSQQTAAAYAVVSGPSDPEDVNAPIFDMPIDRSSVYL